MYIVIQNVQKVIRSVRSNTECTEVLQNAQKVIQSVHSNTDCTKVL
jgi:uncharacterized protein YegP (UPF0339 family)